MYKIIHEVAAHRSYAQVNGSCHTFAPGGESQVGWRKWYLPGMPHIERDNGQRIFFSDTEAAGPAVILGHGFLMDRSMFAPLAEAFGDRYRLITWDARSFGESGWNNQPYSCWDSAHDIVALLDHLGIERAVVGGMSQGGYSAMRVALRWPDRVSGLVLLSTMGTMRGPEGMAMFREMAATLRQHGFVEPMIEGLAGTLLGDKKFWEPWTSRWRTLDPKAIAAGVDQLTERDDIADQLKSIKCPAFVAHGTADHGTEISHGQALVDVLQADPLVRLEGGAHAAAYTHADQLIGPLAAWLDRTQRAAAH